MKVPDEDYYRNVPLALSCIYVYLSQSNNHKITTSAI